MSHPEQSPPEPVAWKLLSMLKRRPTLSHEEFVAYWREVHAPLLAQQQDFWRHVRRYVQNYGIDGAESPVGLPYVHDGVSELWFDSFEGLKAAVAEPGFQGPISEDLARFVDAEGSISWISQFIVIKELRPTSIKMFVAGRVKEGMSRAEGQRYWRDVHPATCARFPEFWSAIQTYGQNHARSPEGVALESLSDEYDMSSEIGAESQEALEAAFELPEYAEFIQPDETEFAALGEAPTLVTRESILFSR